MGKLTAIVRLLTASDMTPARIIWAANSGIWLEPWIEFSYHAGHLPGWLLVDDHVFYLALSGFLEPYNAGYRGTRKYPRVQINLYIKKKKQHIYGRWSSEKTTRWRSRANCLADEITLERVITGDGNNYCTFHLAVEFLSEWVLEWVSWWVSFPMTVVYSKGDYQGCYFGHRQWSPENKQCVLVAEWLGGSPFFAFTFLYLLEYYSGNTIGWKKLECPA